MCENQCDVLLLRIFNRNLKQGGSVEIDGILKGISCFDYQLYVEAF